jgi:hypothetical protein
VTVALGAVLGLVYLALSRSSPAVPPTVREATPEQSQAPAEVRTLTYSLTLQRDPKRFPGGKPIPLVGGDAVFSAGDRVRLAFTSPQGGHLYVFNEGPPRAGGSRTVHVLFPSPTSNNGSAELAGGQTVAIPGGNGFVFDNEEGVETLSIVWSRSDQPRLEALKHWANAEDLGEIKDVTDIGIFDTFLRDHASPRPDAVIDEAARATRLSAQAEVFVRTVRLEHH